MIMMEEVPDAPVIMKNDHIVKTQNENIPINDNTCPSIAVNTNVHTIDNNATDINTNDGSGKSTPKLAPKVAVTPTQGDYDEDLEEGEIDDEDEDDPPKEDCDPNVATVDLTKSSKNSQESSEHSENSDILNKHRTDEESDHSESGRRNGERDQDRKRDRKGRRDKRSERDLRKEIQDDEAKKRAIKEKIRALEMQMKLDEDEVEDEEDLEEMGIEMVGGSPTREDRKRRKMKSESDSNAEVDHGQREKDDRSGSRSPKRRKRDGEENRRRRGRDQENGKRGFNSGGFGSGFGRNGPRGGEKSSELCKLFMQGKCPKSPQNCMYSHDAVPPKIMELCKFYLLERCAKREKCLYLHKGFPCKYFHTGHRCMDDAESCKFSHENLTDVTRSILLKHLEAAPKEILGDFPRLSREKALELVYKNEAKNKGWDLEIDKPREVPHKSAADNFVEQQTQMMAASTNSRANEITSGGFGQGEGAPNNSSTPQESSEMDNSKKSRWETDTGGGGGRGFDTAFQQGPPPPLVAGASSGFFRGPSLGPRGLGNRPLGPRAPMGLGFGPRGPSGGLGLLGQAPGMPPFPQRMLRSGFPQGVFNQRDQPLVGERLGGMVPPGYGEPDFGEDQVKNFLRSHRQAQEDPSGPNQQLSNSNNAKWGQTSHDEWSGPTIPAGPNSFTAQAVKSDFKTDNLSANDKSGQRTPERETTPTPEDNMDFGEDPENKEGKTEEKPISQRKVYEKLKEKQNERKASLEPVKETNPMFKEDNWYSSEEESEERSDRSFSEELMRTPANLKKKSPERKGVGTKENGNELGGVRPLQTAVAPTILSCRETPATPPPPPTLSASDRDSMEASAAASNAAVTLPKELCNVLSSIQKASSSSPLLESNQSAASSKKDQRTSRDPRQQQKNDPRTSRPSGQSGGDSLSDSEREREKEKRILEMDLSIFGELDLPTFKDSEDNSTGNESPATEEENALGLPFKPHKVHQVAKEIDASINSHSPLEYRLRAILIAKPDYSDMIVKQHIPASKVQQDPRLRRYSNKISGKTTSSAGNLMLFNDRRFSDDGIEIMSPPGPKKSNSDPRRHKNPANSNQKHNQNLSGQQNTGHQEEENVYNPKKDLYSSRQQQPQQYQSQQMQHQQQQDSYAQEVYSPTQDVQDMYTTKSRKHHGGNNQNEENLGGGGIYNPRQDLNPSQRNPSDHMDTLGCPPGIPPLGIPPPTWGGGGGGPPPYNPYDNFYGAGRGGGPPNQGFYDAGGNQNDEMGFYNDGHDGLGGNRGRGGFRGGHTHGGMMIAGGGNRSNDPRTNRRDPRRKD